MNSQRITNVLLLILLLFILVAVVRPSYSLPGKVDTVPAQRFSLITPNEHFPLWGGAPYSIAFDTSTAQLCKVYPWDDSNAGQFNKMMPLCRDLVGR
jgi:hypothetical protein